MKGSRVALVSRCAWTLYNFRSGLIRSLKEKGATVIGGGAGGDGFEKKIRDLGVPFFDLPVDKRGINPAMDVKLLYALYRWYRKERPDIVHHFTIKPVIYGSIAAKFAGIPKIVNTITGLGYVFTANERKWLRSIAHFLYRVALRGTHVTFFQNMEDQRYFLRNNLTHGHDTSVLPGSGVDCAHFRPLSDNSKAPDGGPAFLMLTRLLKDKGVYEFVEAAKRVRQVYTSSRFLLLGRRDERNPSVVAEKDLERWQRKGIVEWLGEVEDVRPSIADADVVVLPSYREGLPRSLLEAAAMGKPVITTDAVGCRDAVEHGRTGLMVPVKDSAALADAMKEMIKNPEMRSRMGREGRRKMELEFDEKIVLKKILEVYGCEKLSA
ncbi:MAG: glycosyltransferase family 4 protein [Deltaproteobacteria bacterium]|nr:glycosyltransferase family 4 protein [Deltaproteobacteria bacterium]